MVRIIFIFYFLLISIGMANTSTNLFYWAATDKQVKEANCRKLIPTNIEIEFYLNNITLEDKQKDYIIKGVNFYDESEQLIEVYKKLITKFNLLGKELKKQVDIQRQFRVNPECKKVICAIKKIFGNRLGPKLLYMNHKYGLNGSHLAYRNAAKLTNDEINRMIAAAQDYPSFMFPLKKNKQYTKFTRGKILAEYSSTVMANAMITFFDNWKYIGGKKYRTKEEMERTAFHELSHYVAMQLDLDKSTDWLLFSGWIKNKKKEWRALKLDSFPSKYARQNPKEDFAESVVAFRYNPDFLLRVAPDKYKYIKETVFHGIEYITEDKCHSNNSYDYIIREQATEELISYRGEELLTNKSKLKKLLISCRKQAIGYIYQNSSDSISELDRCILEEVFNSEEIDKLGELDLNYIDLILKKRMKFPLVIKRHEINGIKDVYLGIKKLLKEIIVNSLYNWSRNHYDFYLPNKFTRLETYCRSFSNGSYKSISEIELLGGESLSPYKYYKLVTAFYYNSCLKLHTDLPMIKSISRNQINKLIENSMFSNEEPL